MSEYIIGSIIKHHHHNISLSCVSCSCSLTSMFCVHPCVHYSTENIYILYHVQFSIPRTLDVSRIQLRYIIMILYCVPIFYACLRGSAHPDSCTKIRFHWLKKTNCPNQPTSQQQNQNKIKQTHLRHLPKTASSPSYSLYFSPPLCAGRYTLLLHCISMTSAPGPASSITLR